MNRLENSGRRDSGPGRSRAKGAAKGSGGSRARGSSSYRSGQAGRMNAVQTSRRNSSYRRKKDPNYKLTALIGVILLVVILCAALALYGRGKTASTEESSTEAPETEMIQEVTVDGVTITGMSKSEAREAILAEFPWAMTVAFEDDVYEVEDLMAWKVDALLDEIYSGTPKASYTLDTDGMEEEAAQAAEACASRWDKAARNGSIDSYDAENGEFTFAGEEEGFAIDQEKLAQDILAALEAKDFDAEIEAEGSAVAPEITAAQAKEQYKTLSSLTTKTTANSNRNTNIRLAAEAINGTIVKPGEEFSFNGTVGQRTEAKGYKGAAAYNNGEVVQEIGGGVCQVSTTLYGAVFRAGLEITYRRSHTFEPNYITPGQDATVSWEQPDFKFRNNSSAAIGIRASYSNQKMTVSIYGIPILEEGVTWDLESKKTEDVAPPAPTYEEDQTLQPGVEVVKSAGSMGSRWETYKVVYKDGVEVSRELDHRATYKGHAPVIQRNTTGIVLPPEETTTSAETPVQTVDGMPEGYVPSSSAESGGPGDPSQGDVNSGPGVETTAAPPSTTAPAETLPAGPGEGSAAPAESPQESEKTDAMVIAPLDPQA